jgi:hypothetical protein
MEQRSRWKLYLPYLTLPYLTLPYLTLPYIILYYITLLLLYLLPNSLQLADSPRSMINHAYASLGRVNIDDAEPEAYAATAAAAIHMI